MTIVFLSRSVDRPATPPVRPVRFGRGVVLILTGVPGRTVLADANRISESGHRFPVDRSGITGNSIGTVIVGNDNITEIGTGIIPEIRICNNTETLYKIVYGRPSAYDEIGVREMAIIELNPSSSPARSRPRRCRDARHGTGSRCIPYTCVDGQRSEDNNNGHVD